MKKFLLLALATATLRADEVALLEFRFADKSVRTAAIELYPDAASATVENFKTLARDGFYNGCAVHRAFPSTLVQMGDPLSKKKDRTNVGTGGPGYTLPAEIRRKHTKGAVAAARLPDRVNPQRRSNGSQFYVCLIPQPKLDGQYTVFGNVIQGMDVLDVISNKPTDTNDNPIERIELRRVSIVPRESLPQAAPAVKPGEVPPGEGPKRSFWRRMWPW
jgi:cyclophilin family peptidyl-prolyl cis-trans isomerase